MYRVTGLRCNTRNPQIPRKPKRFLKKFFSNPSRPLSWLKSLQKRFRDISIFVTSMAQIRGPIWIGFACTTFREITSNHFDMNHFNLCFKASYESWRMYLHVTKVILAISHIRKEKWSKVTTFKNPKNPFSNPTNTKCS